MIREEGSAPVTAVHFLVDESKDRVVMYVCTLESVESYLVQAPGVPEEQLHTQDSTQAPVPTQMILDHSIFVGQTRLKKGAGNARKKLLINLTTFSWICRTNPKMFWIWLRNPKKSSELWSAAFSGLARPPFGTCLANF